MERVRSANPSSHALAMGERAEHASEGQLSRRKAWAVSVAVALGLYGSTMGHGLLWGDSGEAQLHVLLDGWYVDGQIARSHVLYYAIARFVRSAFSLEAALAANLIAVIAGALTVANVSWLIATVCRRPIAVAGGTLLLLLSHTLWQLSAGAEVITVSTALLSAELMAFMKLVETRRFRWLAVVALCNGLGVSNHNFALLMWPVYFVVALRWRSAWPTGGQAARDTLWALRRRAVAVAAGALLLGMAPVLALCIHHWRAGGSLPETLQSFLVGGYGAQVVNFSALPRLFLRSVAMLALNFPSPLLVLMAPGALQFVIRNPQFPLRNPPACWVFLGAALSYTAFGARYNVSDQHTFLVPAFLFAAIFIAVGIDRMLNSHQLSPVSLQHGSQGSARTYRDRILGPAILMFCFSGPVAYALAPPLLRKHAPDLGSMPTRVIPYRDPLDWFLHPWRVEYDGAERYARETLISLPPDAWLVADSTLCSPLNYLQVAKSLRLDVRLDGRAARQDWFETSNMETLRREKLSKGLLFVACDEPEYQPDWLHGAGYRFEASGTVFRVRKPGLELLP